MYKLRLAGAFACLVVGGAAYAQPSSPALEQVSQCVLTYTGNTGSPAAVQLIRSACNDLYNHLGLSSTSSQPYDNCLLQHLSGAQSDAAAGQIVNACAIANPRS